jgi:hypothetical protein
MWAQPVTIAYQQKDLHLFTSSPTSNGEMSSVMKIGIGVGVALASVILILLVGLLLLHKRKKQRKLALMEASQELHGSLHAEEEKKEGMHTAQTAEMDGTQTQLLEADLLIDRPWSSRLEVMFGTIRVKIDSVLFDLRDCKDRDCKSSNINYNYLESKYPTLQSYVDQSFYDQVETHDLV